MSYISIVLMIIFLFSVVLLNISLMCVLHIKHKLNYYATFDSRMM